MTSTETKTEKVPWLIIIPMTIVLSFLAMASFRLMTPQGSWWMCKFNFGVLSRVTQIAVYPYLLLALIYPFRKRLKLSPSMLTYIYTAGLISSFTLGFGYEDWVLQLSRPRIYDTIGLLNVWWEPPLTVIQAMIQGGVATDWALWAPIVSVVSFLYLSFFFFTSSIVLIFRRSWLDIEKMPFPLALTGYELIKVDSYEKSYIGKKVFAVGILLGFAYVIPVFLTKIFPWFPDIYSSSLICPTGAYHPPENYPLGTSIIGLASVSADPTTAAIFFLAPLSVSFNVWFWTLGMFIVEQIAFYMGYYTGVQTMSGAARICCTYGPGTGPPFYWPIESMVGGFLALTVMYIVLHRSYVLDTLGQAMHRKNPELEKDEVMSYRSMYAMMFLSLLLCAASLMILGIDLLAAFVIIFASCFMTWFAITLALGMAGFGDAGGTRVGPVGFLRLVWPDPSTAPTNLDFVMSHLWAIQGTNVVTYGFGNGFFTTSLSLKMASLTGANNKDTFRVAVVCMLISVPVILASSVWFVNVYGVKVLSYFTCALQDQCEANPARQAARPSGSLYASYGAVGFVITMLLAFMHARFIWFPFEPIGFVIATTFIGQWSGIWSTFLVAWIAKTIVLRVGGSSLYEKYALPIVGGFITGDVLASVIAIVTGMARFYIPF